MYQDEMLRHTLYLRNISIGESLPWNVAVKSREFVNSLDPAIHWRGWVIKKAGVVAGDSRLARGGTRLANPCQTLLLGYP